MSQLRDDDLLALCAALPERDVGAAAADRIRRTARGVFVREAELRRSPTVAALAHLWNRFLEPALVAATIVVYLSWAGKTVVELHRTIGAELAQASTAAEGRPVFSAPRPGAKLQSGA